MKSSKRIVIATGGTGGHVFPAQALGAQLEERGYEVLFMGKGLKTNRYFKRSLFSHVSIDAATPLKKKLLQKAVSFVALSKGLVQALRHLMSFKPSLVVGFGSFHSFPVLGAALMARIPIVLFESNAIPGRVNQLFSRSALFSGVHFSQAKKKMKGKCREVSMPFWAKVGRKPIKKVEALDYFSLPPEGFTVLVFGGSQGAALLNETIAETLNAYHRENPLVQVIHMTGCEKTAEETKLVYLESGIPAHVKSFEENMDFAWSSADMVISRAGAGAIAEMMEFEVPSILIPYPHAAAQHQLRNAECISEEVPGTHFLEEKHLSPKELLMRLKACDVNTMKRSIQQYKKKRGRRAQLVDHIEEALSKKRRRS